VKSNFIAINENLNFFLVYSVFSIFLFLFIIIYPDSIGLPLAFISILVFSFPIGYVTLLPFKEKLDASFLSIIPLCLCLGFIMNYLWILSVSSFTLNKFVFFSLFFLSIGILIYLKFKTRVSSKHKIVFDTLEIKKRDSFNIFKKNNEKFLLILFFIPSILYLSVFTYFPDPIDHTDLAHVHDRLTNSILQKGLLDPYWLTGENIGYPIGWHVTTVGFINLFNIESLQMGYVVLGVASFLIYGLLLSISYFLTRSVLIATASSTAFFFAPLGDPQGYLYGTFVNALAPFNLGLLCIVSALCIFILLNNKSNKQFLWILLLLFIGTGLAYPPLIIYFIIWVALYLIIKDKEIKNFEFKSAKNIFKHLKISSFNLSHLVFVIVIVGTLVGELYVIQYNIVNDALNSLNKFPESAQLTFSAGFTYVDLPSTKFFVPLLIIFSMVNLFYFKEGKYFSLIAITSILIASFASYSFYEGFFVPRRINVFIVPFTWILFGLIIRQTEILIYKKIPIQFQNFKTSNKIFQKFFDFLIERHLTIIFIVLTIIIFTPHVERVVDLFGGSGDRGLYWEFPRP